MSSAMRAADRAGTTYEVHYLVVAGVAWIRHTDGPERAVWLATFDGEPVLRKQPVETLPPRLEEGELDGVAWRREVEPLAAPYRAPPRLLRPFASTQLELVPAVAVSGELGGRRLDRAPGHLGHVWGRRHADRWTWAHASLPDGRWADVLTAKARGLPQLSFWATHEGSGFGRGGFVVEAGPEVVATYLDPDGSTRVCRHSEGARLRGRGIDTDVAACERGGRPA
jgi:hypothetical protein